MIVCVRFLREALNPRPAAEWTEYFLSKPVGPSVCRSPWAVQRPATETGRLAVRVCAGKDQRCIMDPLCDVDPVTAGRSIDFTSQRRLTNKLLFPVTHEIILAGLPAFRRGPARLGGRVWVRGALT